jgi:hypothetical protein
MEYTTYIEDNTKHGLDQFAWLKIQIDRASKNGDPIYILGISREDHMKDLEGILERLRNLPHIYDVVPINGTIGCIATGNRGEIEELAKQIHTESYGNEVGCVEYDSTDNKKASGPYEKIRSAIRTARREGRPYYFYDSNTDSFEALVKKARTA